MLEIYHKCISKLDEMGMKLLNKNIIEKNQTAVEW